MLQRIYFTNKYWTLPYYNANTTVADYSRILFSGVELSKEFVYITLNMNLSSYQLKKFIFVWLLIKFINSYIWKGVVFIFMDQFWVCILLNGDFIKTILIPPLWKTYPMSTKNIPIELQPHFFLAWNYQRNVLYITLNMNLSS